MPRHATQQPPLRLVTLNPRTNREKPLTVFERRVLELVRCFPVLPRDEQETLRDISLALRWFHANHPSFAPVSSHHAKTK